MTTNTSKRDLQLSNFFPYTKMFVVKNFSLEAYDYFLHHKLGAPYRAALNDARAIDIDEVAKTLALIEHFHDTREDALGELLSCVIMERLEPLGITLDDVIEAFNSDDAITRANQARLKVFANNRERLRNAEESHSAIASGAL